MEGRAKIPVTRVYVDMVGDLFHVGHVTLLKAASELGDWLIVGVLSDDVVEGYKRRPIMSLYERAAVVEACRYVDEVIVGSPGRITKEFIDDHAISIVVHGDDVTVDSEHHCYAEVAALGKLHLIKRVGNVSTTEIIGRIKQHCQIT